MLESLPAIIFHRPKRIIVISAHWEEEDAFKITSHERHTLETDFFGFPRECYAVPYAPPGDPKFAKRLAKMLHDEGLPSRLSRKGGLDVGAWLPLYNMYPSDSTPVISNISESWARFC